MRVFSFEELQCRHVPLLESFEQLMDRGRELFSACDDLYGGMFFGSGVFSPSPTGDLDLLLIPYQAHEGGWRKVFQEFEAYAKSLYIPVSPIVIPIKYASEGIHTVRRVFGFHLEEAAERGGVFGMNPIDVLQYTSGLTIAQEIKATIQQKLQTLWDWWASPPKSFEETRRRCAYVLSLAPGICLNMMYLKTNTFRRGTEGLIRCYRDTYTSSTALDALGNLMKRRERYHDILLQVQTSRSEWESRFPMSEWTDAEYERVVGELLDVRILAESFLLRNLECVLSS